MDTQPGQVFMPNDQDPNQGQPPQPAAYTTPQQPVQQPTQPVPGVQYAAPAPEPATATAQSAPSAGLPIGAEEADWQYMQESGAADLSVPTLPDDVAWTAAEFVEHKKSIGWYGVLALVAVVLAAGYYLVTKDYFFTVVIILAALTFGIYASRKPRTQQYHLGPNGVQVGEKTYGYQNFKNFSVAEDGAIASVVFMPLARFAPPLTIYVSQEVEDNVLSYLGLFLPFEQHHSDALDGMLRRIRF